MMLGARTAAWAKTVKPIPSNRKYVVVGTNGKFSTSTDGVNWTEAAAIAGQTGTWQYVV